MREIISLFVDRVIVYSDKVEVVLTYGSDLLKITADEYNRKATALRLCVRNKENGTKKENTTIKNCVFCGGEGPTIPKSKFYFTIPVTIEMVLYRSMQIEDLLFENKIFWQKGVLQYGSK